MRHYELFLNPFNQEAFLHPFRDAPSPINHHVRTRDPPARRGKGAEQGPNERRDGAPPAVRTIIIQVVPHVRERGERRVQQRAQVATKISSQNLANNAV